MAFIVAPAVRAGVQHGEPGVVRRVARSEAAGEHVVLRGALLQPGRGTSSWAVAVVPVSPATGSPAVVNPSTR